MILAGDIGGTNARLAYFQTQNGNLRLIAEHVYPSREYGELGEIVSKFLKDLAVRPEVACFGIAGPVHDGRVETSNLPWIIEQSRLAKQIDLPATLLINDLEAYAWGIGELNLEDLTPLNRVRQSVGNQAVIAPGTGLGEAGLFWNGNQHRVFACEGGHADFAPQGDLQVELLQFLAGRYGHVSYERIRSEDFSGAEISTGFSPAKGDTRISRRKETCRWNCCSFLPGDTDTSVMNASSRSEEHTSELQSLRHLVCR